MTARRAVLVVWLTAVWCLLWTDSSPGTVLAGFGVGLAVSSVVRPGTEGEGHVVRPLAALRFLVWFAGALVRSTWAVAREALTPGSSIAEGIVALPIHGATPLLTTIVANSITLTPETLTLQAEPRGEGRHGLLHVHALHLGDPEELVGEVARIEDLVVRAFGPAHAVASLEEPLPVRAARPARLAGSPSEGTPAVEGAERSGPPDASDRPSGSTESSRSSGSEGDDR